MTSKGSFSSSVGWSGSAPTNNVSIKLGRTNGGYGAQGRPAASYGSAPPGPKFAGLPVKPAPMRSK
jgi:hypothetical protein